MLFNKTGEKKHVQKAIDRTVVFCIYNTHGIAWNTIYQWVFSENADWKKLCQNSGDSMQRMMVYVV